MRTVDGSRTDLPVDKLDHHDERDLHATAGRRAQEMLGWRPHRPDVPEDIERGSYAGGGR